jgi:hypothetical protein
LENLDDKLDINRGWENIRQNTEILAKNRLGHYALEQHKPRFDEECSKL